MTAPLTPEALVEKLARDLARRSGWNDPDAPWTENQVVIVRGGAGEPVWRDFVDDARSLLGRETFTTLLAAHQQVTAERDEAEAKQAVPLTEEQIETRRNRAHEAIVRRLQSERDTANAELARLRAEGEAKDRALASLADNETLLLRAANLIDCGTAKHCEYFFHSKRVSGRHVPAQCARETEEGRGCLADDATSLRILSGKLREATALARAATAREE